MDYNQSPIAQILELIGGNMQPTGAEMPPPVGPTTPVLTELMRGLEYARGRLSAPPFYWGPGSHRMTLTPQGGIPQYQTPPPRP